jgi:cellulose synthase/poly-beta-1,6-N-acetylglucosamine synthase-like glycosyltransferase
MSFAFTIALTALLIIWVGYPLVIGCVAASRRPEVHLPGAGAGETVSVILASCEDAQAIRARVADLLATSYPADRLEVIVALDAKHCRASAEELAGLDARVVVVNGDDPGGKAAALNAAVRAARNEVLVFADTAQRFNSAAIGDLVAALADRRLGAVSGMLEWTGNTGRASLAERYWRYERWLRNREARVHSGVGVTGAIYAMRRTLWEPLPAGVILDDVYAPMQLVLRGWQIGFAEHAIATDTRGFAVGAEYRRKVRTLTGVMQVCAWLPAVLNPVRNPVWLQFVFHKLLRLLTPYLAIVVVVEAARSLAVLVTEPVGQQLTLFGMLAAAIVILVPRIRRKVGAPIVWGVALQTSIVVATVNGLRGRWDVWQQ